MYAVSNGLKPMQENSEKKQPLNSKLFLTSLCQSAHLYNFVLLLVYFHSHTGSAAKEEPRVLGLAMIPGHHIVSIEVDQTNQDAV